MKTVKIPVRQIVFGVISLALLVGVFLVVRALVLSWCATPLPGVSPQGCAGASQSNGPTIVSTQAAAGGLDLSSLPTPEPAAPAVALPPTWDGASRVTVLLMGVDTELVIDPNGKVSPDRVGPARSDTMILLTIDPQSKTAGMMSIPRDLWANIPGFGYAKINTAYYDGDAAKLPGGGPELAMRTVEQVIGVPIQYYAQMEFWAFTQLIDNLGKINVFVEKKIVIDPVGPGSDKIMLSAGPHKLGGVEALAYVRQRHTEDGDVDRSKRQQAVILAVRDHVLNPANFPTILANTPQIYSDIQTGIRTNLTFDEIMRLGMLAKDIPPENIRRGVIDYTMVQLDSLTINGQSQSILKPIPDKIRELRDEIFTASGALSPLAKGTDALDLAKQEGATIAVYNASSVAGLAQRTADYLTSLGLNVVKVDNPASRPGATQVIDHRGRLYALKYFKELFNLNAGVQIVNQPDAAAPADIEIILADDWAQHNPMP
jgi:LCP family protein required for cell wall assembly